MNHGPLRGEEELAVRFSGIVREMNEENFMKIYNGDDEVLRRYYQEEILMAMLLN